MFWITEDPSSGSLAQYLAKIAKMVLSCPLTWMWSVLWQHNTGYVYVNGHDRTISVILAKHCTRGPENGSSATRNMSEQF